MRILVTGASGFIGAVACDALRERGHEVSALVRRPGQRAGGHGRGARRPDRRAHDARGARAGRARRRAALRRRDRRPEAIAVKLRAANIGGLRT